VKNQPPWLIVLAGTALVLSAAFIGYVLFGGSLESFIDDSGERTEQARLDLQNEVSDCRFEPVGGLWRAVATASNSGSSTTDYLVQSRISGDSFASSGSLEVLGLAPQEDRLVELWIGGDASQSEATLTCDIREVSRNVADTETAERRELVNADVSPCRIEQLTDDSGAPWVTVTNNSLDTTATYIIDFVVYRDGEPAEAGFGGITDIAPGATREGALQPSGLDGPIDSLSCTVEAVRQVRSVGSPN